MDTLLDAGSFDPVTRGHMDVIRRAAALCPELVVAVMMQPGEATVFCPCRCGWS